MPTSLFQEINDGLNVETLRRMVAKAEEYGEIPRAHSLPDDLSNLLKDDWEEQTAVAEN